MVKQYVPMQSKEVAQMVCSSCSVQIASNHTYQVRDAKEDYPLYICRECASKK